MRIIFGLLSIVFSGCASVTVLKSAQAIPRDKCNVQVHSSLQAASKGGEMEELCMISGTSSGSFSHNVGTAINLNKHRACQCGADNVYVQAQDAGTLGTASVTLVGFRYLNKKSK